MSDDRTLSEVHEYRVEKMTDDNAPFMHPMCEMRLLSAEWDAAVVLDPDGTFGIRVDNTIALAFDPDTGRDLARALSILIEVAQGRKNARDHDG